MYPTLFTIGSFRIDTYSVVWFIALSLAILWGIRRLSLYDLDEDESRRIMAISFMFMLLGAMVFKQIKLIPMYIADPSRIPPLSQWGLSEFGAVLGAFISGFVMCLFNRKVSFLKLCDVAIIPAFLAIAVGRWGCFLNGCCTGRVTHFFLAVHFPRDRAGVLRHPVQIYYSVIAVLIIMILLYVERKTLPRQKNSKRYYSVIAPLGIILYAIMRISVAFVRDSQPFTWLAGHSSTYQILVSVFPLICLWLAYSLLRLNAENQAR